jgi:hypothetical protein
MAARGRSHHRTHEKPSPIYVRLKSNQCHHGCLRYWEESLLNISNGVESMVIASRLEAEVLAEKWHDMILKAIGDRTRMGSFVNLEAVL